MKRILLLGYMGAGKTTLARMLSKDTGLDFYDLDHYIEGRMHKTIPDLFALRGEDGFREIERRLLHEVAEFEDVVISVGGGTPCFFDNLEYMNRQCDTVYLKATPRVLRAHIGMGTTVRPLLQGKTDEELTAFIEDQLRQRQPYYEKARYTLNVDLLDNYNKIKTSVESLRKMLNV